MSDIQTDYIDEETELPSHRATHDLPGERKCMSCGEPFKSEGWHNRLCLRCRKRSEPDFV